MPVACRQSVGNLPKCRACSRRKRTRTRRVWCCERAAKSMASRLVTSKSSRSESCLSVRTWARTSAVRFCCVLACVPVSCVPALSRQLLVCFCQPSGDCAFHGYTVGNPRFWKPAFWWIPGFPCHFPATSCHFSPVASCCTVPPKIPSCARQNGPWHVAGLESIPAHQQSIAGAVGPVAFCCVLVHLSSPMLQCPAAQARRVAIIRSRLVISLFTRSLPPPNASRVAASWAA